MSQQSSRIVLTYLNTGGRAEATRLVFTIGGVPFEDRRISQEEFFANQTDHSRFPTEQLPVLEIGTKKYTQAMAILRYAGKVSGLYPFDPQVALAVDEALDHIFEVYKGEPAFNKTMVTSAARHSSSNNNSPVANDINNNNSNAISLGSGLVAALAGLNNSNNNFEPQTTRDRKNSPVPPLPYSGRDSFENSLLLHQQNHFGDHNQTSNPTSPPLLAKAGSINCGVGAGAGASWGDVTEQIKLCFRRICALINYDIYSSPYIASPRPTIADFAVLSLVRQIQRGMIPHVASTFLEAPEFAPLYQLVDILEDYPGVKYFYEKNL
jgi:glutathione S-transferase